MISTSDLFDVLKIGMLQMRRMILGLALACAGPVCGAFNLDPPGAQYVGEGGAGKTPLARIISAVWGWDPNGSTRLGFGTSWKMKPGGLEVVAEATNCCHPALEPARRNLR